MKYSILSLFTIGFFLGIELEYLIYYMILFTSNYEFEMVRSVSYIAPATLGFIQLIFALSVFIDETPKYSYEELMEDRAAVVLVKLYNDSARRAREHEILSTRVSKMRYNYPSYRMLFSSVYIWPLLKGIPVIILRNCSCLFLFITIDWENRNLIQIFSLIYPVLCAVGALIPFFCVDSIVSSK